MTKKQIKKLLKDKGWSQSKLAQMLGVDKTAVSHWLAGRRGIRAGNLEKLKAMGAEE